MVLGHFEMGRAAISAVRAFTAKWQAGRWKRCEPLKQIGKIFNSDAPHRRDLCEDSMEGACFQRIVIGNGNEMNRRPWVTQPDVTSLLAKHFVSEAFQHADHALTPQPETFPFARLTIETPGAQRMRCAP
jgi:hypothetical protein